MWVGLVHKAEKPWAVGNPTSRLWTGLATSTPPQVSSMLACLQILDLPAPSWHEPVPYNKLLLPPCTYTYVYIYVCVCVCVCIYIYISLPSRASFSLPPHHLTPLGHHRALGTLCYTAACYQLFILRKVVYICQCYSLNLSHLLLPPLCPFSMSVSLFLPWK